MQRDESVDAPQNSVKWAKNLFLARIAESKQSLMQKVLAVLQMDLSPNKPAFGERSATGSIARQMFFEAGEIGIDLRVSVGEKGFDLRGQILGEGFENTLVKIGEFETKTNDLNEFILKSVPSGNYNLILQNSEKEIVIENLELQ